MTELKRVLCAEDDVAIREIMQFSLVRVGKFEVCMCANGREALAEAPRFKPQVILLDVMMPGLTGPETLARLRQDPDLAGVPVVFVTAKATLDELESLSSQCVAGIIVKPFTATELPANVRQFWASHHAGR